MPPVIVNPLSLADADSFLQAVHRSTGLHAGLVEPPTTQVAFQKYLNPDQQVCLKFAVRNGEGDLVGVVNINAIIRGAFQNGCLGFYAFVPHNGRGYMRAALVELITCAFREHGLHRLEANIHPENLRSCSLVESLGFRLEALSPRYLRVAGIWCDHKRYALTAEEWPQDGAT
ncbi:MAG: GNAT family protein [Polyangiaceae bacterium]